MRRGSQGDLGFRLGTGAFAVLVSASSSAIGVVLISESWLSIQKFGIGFWTTTTWDPVAGDFGALPFIWGTLYSSILALLIATPVALGIAIFIAELCPAWLRMPLVFLTELLAAIPSIVYGLWGIFVLVPVVRQLEIATPQILKGLPLFSGPPLGVGMLAAGLILAIMITPFTSSVAREVLKAVPIEQREAAYALGATRFEAIKAALFYARTGIVGAVMLGFGRALGETMAVTMVIGNAAQISLSLFAPQYSMAAVIANEFTEADTDLYLDALVEIGLVLFAITLFVNILSRALIWSMNQSVQEGVGGGAHAGRARGGRVTLGHLAQGQVGGLRRLLRAVDCRGARAARVHLLLRGERGRAARSTWTSSPRCRSRSAKPAAAWPTPSSARSSSSGSARSSPSRRAS